MIEQVTIPEISENVESGTVVSVLVEVGDMIDVDDVLIEFETEKSLVDIPSTVKGRITELFAKEGEEMRVGDVIASVDTAAESAAAETPQEAEEAPREAPAKEPEPGQSEQVKEAVLEQAPEDIPAKPASPEPEKGVMPPPAASGPAPASPSVRRFARELGVDIHRVQASGPGGRISKADVKAYVKTTQGSGIPAAAGDAAGRTVTSPQLPDFSRWGEIELEELDTIRRVTAANMATAWQTVPQVTQFDQADVTGLQEFIKTNADKVARQGGKLTVTAVLVNVIAAALKRFPRFNASIDTAGRKLILKKYINIGIAADTPRGLMVPVVRSADRKSISRLAAEITDLADRARQRKLKPDEMEGGTFTLSNQRGIGGVGFTPIVFWPQVAILGVSRASIMPRYMNDKFEPRSMLPLSLSFDHRLIDGADAARFLRWVCEGIEQPLTMFLE